MSEITLVLATTQVTLEPTATVTASVTNSGSSVERVVLGIWSRDPAALPDDAEWAEVERPLREIGPGGTEQYLVRLAAAQAPAGAYDLKVIAYPADQAPEEYADRGQVLRVTVPTGSGPSPPPPPPLRRWWILVLAAAVLVAITAVAFFLTRPRTAEVPELVGLTQDEAVAVIDGAGLVADVQDVLGPGQVGVVLDQRPSAGVVVPAGSTVLLLVRAGDGPEPGGPVPEPFPLPDPTLAIQPVTGAGPP